MQGYGKPLQEKENLSVAMGTENHRRINPHPYLKSKRHPNKQITHPQLRVLILLTKGYLLNALYVPKLGKIHFKHNSFELYHTEKGCINISPNTVKDLYEYAYIDYTHNRVNGDFKITPIGNDLVKELASQCKF